MKDGLFKTSLLYYVWKVVSTTLLAVASGLVLQAHPEGPAGFVASAALIALFWQQSGWLSHDFCHNQVFKNRQLNHLMGMLTGNVYQVGRGGRGERRAERAGRPCLFSGLSLPKKPLGSGN